MAPAIGEFLKALPSVATSPTAFVGYLVVVIAWATTYLLSRKPSQLFNSIEKLPEKDRLIAIQLEYKTVPKDGVTAAEWLQAKQANYRLIRLGASLLVILVILGLSAYLASVNLSGRKEAQQLVDIENASAQEIATGLKNNGDAKTAEAFMNLHQLNIKAVRAGRELASHEIVRSINELLAPTPFSNHYAEIGRPLFTDPLDLRKYIDPNGPIEASEKKKSLEQE